MHRNGAFNLQESYVFFGVWRVGAPQAEPRADPHRDKYEFGTPDGYRYFLEKGPLSEIDATDFGWDPPFWNDLRAHPDYDDFWKARNLLPHLKNIRAACLVVGGWYDTENLYGALETYRSIEALNPRLENTIIMGPWLHGAWEYLPGDQLGDDVIGFETSMAYRELAVEFWRHHLKGGPRPALPEALVFETGADRWRRFDAWPPREARPTALYFREDHGLSFDPPAGAGADEMPSDPDKPVPYTYKPLADYWHAGYMAEDQRFVASRPDVLVYRTAPLTEDVTIAGPVEVELQVSTTGTDADFVVKLVDGYPGDEPGTPRGEPDPAGHQQLLIRGEPFRGRYRNGDDRPQPFVPDEVATIRFTLDDVFHTFQRGHQIVIHVQPSWFPFVDRNPQTFVPNIFDAKRADFVKATQRVHWSAAAPSKITVNLIVAPDAVAK
jgi:putative CocE/NonD family hydrolase